jgi:hypothetical protein
MNDRECQHCKHWKEAIDSSATERFGECRRFPPQVLIYSEDTPGCEHPLTAPDHYCGEFAAPH